MNETNAPADNPIDSAHPWHNKAGEISAQIAVVHVTQSLLALGVPAKVEKSQP